MHRNRERCDTKNIGSVVQLVRIHACHAWGRGFESRPDRQSFYFRKTKRKSCKTLVLRDFFYGYQPSSPTRFSKSGYFGSGLKPSGSKATLRLSTLPHNYLSVASASECQFVAGSAYCIGCNRYNGRPGGV